MSKKKKRKIPKARNPYVVPSKLRQGAGTHKDKRKKRQKKNIEEGWE